jgi:hypothetical protein
MTEFARSTLTPEEIVTSGGSWVPDMPKPFMSGDQAFFGTAISAVW